MKNNFILIKRVSPKRIERPNKCNFYVIQYYKCQIQVYQSVKKSVKTMIEIKLIRKVQLVPFSYFKNCSYSQDSQMQKFKKFIAIHKICKSSLKQPCKSALLIFHADTILLTKIISIFFFDVIIASVRKNVLSIQMQSINELL